MFFSHNKSGPDFLKQTMLWGLSPPITLCQFQSGLKYDSTVCASLCSKSPPPPPFPFSLCYPFLGPCNLLNFFPGWSNSQIQLLISEAVKLPRFDEYTQWSQKYMDTDAKNVDTQELYMWLMMTSSKTMSINILKKKKKNCILAFRKAFHNIFNPTEIPKLLNTG